MTRTPTAEEVLALWVKMDVPVKGSASYDDWRCEKEAAKNRFERAANQWQAAQGPVTREWFVERFGGIHPGIEIVFDRENGPELVCRKCGRWIRLVNPTRSKIEALVEMLGGES